MISIFSTQDRMNREYRIPKDNIYTHRFLNDLCTGYSFMLGEERGRNNFFTFEPEDCVISNLLGEKQHYDLSHKIEQLVDSVTYSLLMYGKAYVYLIPEYSIKISNDKTEERILKYLNFEEIKGFIKRKDKDQIIFCQKCFAGKVIDIQMQDNQLIAFDIRDMGYSKRFFVNTLKKLGKCDLAQVSTSMITEKIDGYDFAEHTKRIKIQELRAIRNTGWTFGTDGLSDSYILYKKIEQNEFKIKFLNYILDKLNFGFKLISKESDGKLVANIKEKNYKRLWQDYQNGKISVTELTKILYHN